ncbi:MAG: SgcJ/EcaC family oxidoreductase [Thermoguttaceae bacterium]|jgi:uncharacterized protein (TIGR02246 family)
MRHAILIIALAVAGMATASDLAAQQAERAAPAAQSASAVQPAHQQDEQAIRQLADAFTKSYNAKDAKTLASLFAPGAEIVDENGNAFQGRENIEQVFDGIFKEHPKGKIKISIKSIRFVTPATAIEDGTSTVTHEAGEPPERDRYMVVHVKQDGKWIMASARDLADEEKSGEDQLQQLAWLIGDWVDESPDAMVVTSYRWTDNHQFILGDFTVQIGGNPAMTGSQRFGWDPLTKQIRCWVFDSQGGFAEGVWTREGNRWIVKMNGVTRDGKSASSTNITTMLSKDRMTWQSRDRVIGGEKAPDVEEVPIVRKPPKPL